MASRHQARRRLLQLLLAVQAAAAAAIAYAALRLLGVASPWAALLLGVGCVLLVRLLISANNFAQSARFSSATPDAFRLGPAARLRLFGEEFMASMLHSSWFMARAKGRRRIYPDSRSPPVLLLHGYGCNSGYWAHLTPLLDAARISHASLDLEPILGGIDEYVPMVQRAAETLCADSGAPRLIIVAHSMGGLVARAYLRAHGTARIARLITLGTPHHGTSLASFGLGRNAAQMRRAAGAGGPPSEWLRALAASESAETRAVITSIFTHHDNIIAPQTSSVLAGARHIEFGGVGHVALGRNPRILAQVMREVAALSQPR
jgi:triacylglycerol esterase/lipase EstA (alpha/beta hydrolase family)